MVAAVFSRSFTSLLAISQLLAVSCLDSPNARFLREGQCQATCLSEYGSSNNYLLRTGDYVRKYRCVGDCEDCWNACTFNSVDCHSKCRRMKNASTCAFGCDHMRQFQDVGSPIEISNVTNDTSHPAAALSFLCMNVLSSASHSILGSFVVKWSEEPNSPHVFVYESRYKLYSMEIKNHTDSSWLTLGTRPSRSFALKNMFPSTKYQVRAFPIDRSGLLSYSPLLSPWIETLSDEATLLAPLAVRVISQKPTMNGQMEATVEWTPDPHYPSCFYRLTWRDNDYIESRAFPIDEGFRYVISPLKYSTEYTVMIRAMRDTKHASPESSPVVTTFTTWSCLEANRFDFNVCAPGAVQSLDISVFDNATAIVQWTPPSYVTVTNIVLHYLIRYRSLVHVGRCLKHVTELVRQSSDQTFLTIPNLDNNCHYVVGVSAVSTGGVGPETLTEFNYTRLDDPYFIIDRLNMTVTVVEQGYERLYALLLIPFTVLLTLGVVLIYFKMRPNNAANKKSLIDPHHTALKSVLERNLTYRCAHILPITHGSVPAQPHDLGPYLKLLDQIGSGEFGCVYSALCTRKDLPKMVAVKTLRPGDSNPSAERILDLEIELMQRMNEPHRNVVQFFGVCSLTVAGCTRKGLVMEYCPLGNLKRYLERKRDEHLRHIQRSTLSPTDSGYGAVEFRWSGSTVGIDGNAATMDDNSTTPTAVVAMEARQLLLYAWQVCCGMVHLGEQQLVHRDLAARNVLVADEGQIVKISDFGLCRVSDIVGEYHLTSLQQPKLPVRWMAPEAIRTCVFSSQSDVWSFGIFLWELFTIGDDPYPGYTCDQIPELLKSGYRMPKPLNCDQELYSIMLQCWQDSPSDRPLFNELQCQLEQMLERSSRHNYIHVIDA